LIEPGAHLPARQPTGQQPVERSGTVIETDDDIRQAFLSGHKGHPPGPPVAVDPPAPIPAPPPPPQARSAVPFRPTVRPPVAMLTVFDNGKTDGETIRIRDHQFIKNEYWIGSDPSCPICRPDDPFCEPRHVRLYRGGSRGGWHAEHHKTPNGLWLRMPQITVESVARFQIGEQRFQLRVK